MGRRNTVRDGSAWFCPITFWGGKIGQSHGDDAGQHKDQCRWEKTKGVDEYRTEYPDHRGG